MLSTFANILETKKQLLNLLSIHFLNWYAPLIFLNQKIIEKWTFNICVDTFTIFSTNHYTLSLQKELKKMSSKKKLLMEEEKNLLGWI